MTLAWRINGIVALFAFGWIVAAWGVERSELLFEPSGLRLVAGLLLALVGELSMVRGGASRGGVAVAVRGNASETDVANSRKGRDSGASLAPRATSTGNDSHHLPVAERQAPLGSAAFAPAKEVSPFVRRDGDVASTRVALTPEAMWAKARGMVHNEIPEYATDRTYLALVRSAADSGHSLALRKLGEYAFRRGCCVEAAYWEFQALRRGAPDEPDLMDMYAEQWVENGCPDEEELVSETFTPEQNSFGRSALRFHSGVDVSLALARFAEKAKSGDADAKAFLEWVGVS